MKILIVDDELYALSSVERLLRHQGLSNAESCNNGAEAIELIKEKDFDIVILDQIMPEVTGMDVLEATKPFKPDTEFIMLTAEDEVESAVKAIRLGAFDYLVKPAENEKLFLTIERAYSFKGLKAGKSAAHSDDILKEIPEAFSHMLTNDPRMIELLNYTQIMARGSVPILITGESGTGKELLAKGIHAACPVSAGGSFVPVNVSAIPETLFESQFFGHTKGSFTGASHDYAGFFEQADNGTLFLDEVGELPVNLQAKILRSIEEKIVTRLGESKQRSVRINIVSATNSDVDKACREGLFRLDLLYRLKSAHVHLPPLRERRGDIPLLAEHFLEQACAAHNKKICYFSSDAMSVLTQMDYPGNIRELLQLINKAVLLTDSNKIEPKHLGDFNTAWESLTVNERRMCSLKENEFSHVAYVLNKTKGNRKETARVLGISLRQVQNKLAVLKNNPQWKSFLNNV